MAAKLGEKHHKAKLTEDDVRESRKLYAEGVSIQEIWGSLIEVGVDIAESSLRVAIHGQTWSHVK
jgi:hypothetical protein